MADIRKLKDKAQTLAIKGKYAKALQLYQKIVEENPKDLKIWVKIGDLYRKLKRPEQAIEIYAKAARAFAMSGFLMQAISVNKMILEIDPTHSETQSSLAELYAKKEGHQATAGTTTAKAVPAASLDVLEKMKKKGSKSGVFMPDEERKTEPVEAAPVVEEAPPAVQEEAIEIGVSETPAAEEAIDIEIASEAEDAIVEDEALEIGLDDDEEIEIDDADLADDDIDSPNFDELDLDFADNLFDSIMQQEEIELPTGGSSSAADMSLPNIPLFSSLEADEFNAVIKRLNLRRFDVRDRIIKEGERGDSFYIIAHGSAEVVKRDPEGKEIKVAVLKEGSFFGEFAFFNDSERHASVVVTQEMEALEIDRNELQEVIDQFPRVEEVMKQFYRERLLGSLLKISPLFQPFSDEEKQEILERFEPVKYDAGSIIIKQGKEGDGLYLILAGEVVVNVKTPEGDMHEVAMLAEGSFFGEISLIEDKLTTANCLAADDTEIFRLPRDAFKEMIMVNPRLLEVVSEFSQKRSAQTERIVAGGENALAQAGMV